jgi:hypothetical protein
MLEFTLKLTEQEVSYIVNVALSERPIKEALPLMQKIISQAQAQAQGATADPA